MPAVAFQIGIWCIVVGLEFSVLHYYELDATADLECLLCNEYVNAKTSARINHFTSYMHRVTYIVRSHASNWPWPLKDQL
jgi:hypothetical protein